MPTGQVRPYPNLLLQVIAVACRAGDEVTEPGYHHLRLQKPPSAPNSNRSCTSSRRSNTLSSAPPTPSCSAPASGSPKTITVHSRRRPRARATRRRSARFSATVTTPGTRSRGALGYLRADVSRAVGLYPYCPVFSSAQEPIVRHEGREVIMMGTNSYLGLGTDPRVKAAARDALRNLRQWLFGFPDAQRHPRVCTRNWLADSRLSPPKRTHCCVLRATRRTSAQSRPWCTPVMRS